MNYRLSSKILKKVKGSQRILINCHRSPDPDSVGSALSLYQVLTKMGKKVTIVCPDKIYSDIKFLPFAEKIEQIDFEKYSFKDYDLFVVLDSASVDQVTASKKVSLPKIYTILIDHHISNKGFGEINLIEPKASSCAEILYLIFQDWKIVINPDLAQTLLTGIIADTGVFAYPSVTSKTFEIAKDLMDKGANKAEIVQNIFRSIDFEKVKFWGEILRRMEFDKEHNFIWSAVPFEVYSLFGKPGSSKETAASLFAPIVKDSDFGFIAVEEEKGILSVSFRSRTGFDVSKIALHLGGGGHMAAAAARIYGLDFDKAVLKILETARKYVKKVSERN